MTAPFLVGVALLVAGPALGTAVLATFDWDLIGAPRFVGLGNARDLLEDQVFRRALANSLSFVAVAVPARLVVASGLAMLLHRPARGAGVARGAALVPSVMPDAAYAVLWLWLLNPLFGPVNLVLGAAGLPTPAWLTQPGPSRWAVVIMSLFVIGDGFLLALAARRAVPAGLHELAAGQGATPWAAFRRVTLPIMAPALLLMVCRDTVASFQATFVPALLVTDGGPPPYATTYLPLYIYRQAFEYLRYGKAAAATLVVLAITAAAVWLQFRAVDGLRRGGLLARVLD